MVIPQLEALMFIPIFPPLQFCRIVGKAVILPIMHHHVSFLGLELHAVPGRCAVPGRGCGPWWAWMLRAMLVVGVQPLYDITALWCHLTQRQHALEKQGDAGTGQGSILKCQF